MIRHREKTVNSKATPGSFGPTIDEMRLSRLSHPRATLLAMILLATVFLLFGMFASAAVDHAYMPAPATFDGALVLIGNWVLGCIG